MEQSNAEERHDRHGEDVSFEVGMGTADACKWLVRAKSERDGWCGAFQAEDGIEIF